MRALRKPGWMQTEHRRRREIGRLSQRELRHQRDIKRCLESILGVVDIRG